MKACSGFLKDQNEIVNGDMTKVNPDDVEGNVDNYWRTLYKCEKEMKNNPVAQACLRLLQFLFHIKIFCSIFTVKNMLWYNLAKITSTKKLFKPLNLSYNL